MTALICGSFAYDSIMLFNDQFKNHILPDKIHMLNVSFLVPELRREYGGCAGNIAYNLNCLGGQGLPMGMVGMDFDNYAAWMDKCKVKRTHVRTLDSAYTAQAYITTDMDDNQITAFHPGAMNFSHENKVTDAKDISIGIVSPDGRQGMIEHAAQFQAKDIPFIFDPGQGLPMFEGDDLLRFIEQATWLTLNDYEAELMCDKTKLSVSQIAAKVKALVVTCGAKGSRIYTANNCLEIPAAKALKTVDPTGCGDAYRGGLLYALMAGMDWPTIGRVAGLMGAIKIATHGTQNHQVTLDQFQVMFKQHYDYVIN